MRIGKWNGHVFTVSPSLIYSFTDLSIQGSSETEDKKRTSNSRKYTVRKAGNPWQVSLTAELNAFTGCLVRKEALTFVREATEGAKAYLYIAGKKLCERKLILTQAAVSDVVLSPRGEWLSCKVKLTMKQAAAKGDFTKAPAPTTRKQIPTKVGSLDTVRGGSSVFFENAHE